jgi:hypothetical protein
MNTSPMLKILFALTTLSLAGPGWAGTGAHAAEHAARQSSRQAIAASKAQLRADKAAIAAEKQELQTLKAGSPVRP